MYKWIHHTHNIVCLICFFFCCVLSGLLPFNLKQVTLVVLDICSKRVNPNISHNILRLPNLLQSLFLFSIGICLNLSLIAVLHFKNIVTQFLQLQLAHTDTHTHVHIENTVTPCTHTHPHIENTVTPYTHTHTHIENHRYTFHTHWNTNGKMESSKWVGINSALCDLQKISYKWTKSQSTESNLQYCLNSEFKHRNYLLRSLGVQTFSVCSVIIKVETTTEATSSVTSEYRKREK